MSGRARSVALPLRWLGVAVLLAVALLTSMMAWQQWRTHRFEHDLLAMEVDNRARLSGVLLPSKTPVPRANVAADNADRSELRARWWQVWAERSSGAQQRRILWQQARDELRLAVQQRPASGFAWANLASMKAQLGSIDAEFDLAFNEALRLAPFEARVHRQLLGVLLRHPQQTEHARDLHGRLLMQRMQPLNAPLLIALASRYHALPWMCDDDNAGAMVRDYCHRQGYPLPSTSVP